MERIMAFNNTFNNIQMSSESYTGAVKRTLTGALMGGLAGNVIGKKTGNRDKASALGSVIGVGIANTVFRPDSVNQRASDAIAKTIGIKNSTAADAINTDDSATAEAIQELFSKSPLTSKAVHEFRNNRHKEFLEHNPFAVRLRSFASGETVAFRVTPDIVESRNVSYRTIDPLHMPGSIQVFQNTAPRSWNLSAIKLVSRNGVEAEENLSIINQLRTWQMPFFGNSRTSGQDGFNAELFGAPPEVLEFTAYSSITEDTVTNIRQIPVVVVHASIQYNNDVDYIKTEKTNQPFPAIISVDLNLIEAHSPRDFNRFNILDYKQGRLKGF